MNDPSRAALNWLLRGTADDRLRATWRIVTAVLLIFGGALSGSLLVQRLSVPGLFVPVTAHFFAAAAALIAVMVLGRYVDRRTASDYGLDSSLDWGLDAVAGTALGVALVGAAFGLSYQRDTLTVVDELSAGAGASFALGLGVVLLGWVFVAFWEEVLFRGFFLTNAAEGLRARGLSGPAASVGGWASSSLVYGLFHGPFGSTSGPGSPAYALGMTVVMGGLFGIAYLLSDSLAFPIGLHTGINFAENDLFLGDPEGVAPAVLRVEQSLTGSSVEFQSIDPVVLLPVFLLGYALVCGWVYLRQGALSPGTRLRTTGSPPD